MFLSTTVLLVSLSLINAVNGSLLAYQQAKVDAIALNFSISLGNKKVLESLYEEVYSSYFRSLIPPANQDNDALLINNADFYANLHAENTVRLVAETFTIGINRGRNEIIPVLEQNRQLNFLLAQENYELRNNNDQLKNNNNQLRNYIARQNNCYTDNRSRD